MAEEYYYLEHYLYRLISKGDYARAMESLVENIDLDIFVVNSEGTIYIWNRSLERTVCPKHQAIGRPFWEVFPAFLEEYQGTVWGDRVMREVLDQGKVVEQLRVPLPTCEGQIRVYDLKAFPLRVEGVQRSGAVIVRHDTTRRIQLEEQLVRHARTSSLASLGAAVAHEIRNPLNSISMNLQLIQEWVGEEDEIPRQEVIETVDVMRAEIQRLDRIIKDFLQFSRPPAPRYRFEEPTAVVESTLRLVGEQARRSGIEVIREFDADLPAVRMDRDQFSQALYNLILNALQEMPEGGTLTAGIRLGNDFLQYSVRDSGPGLPPQEDKDRFFDLFFSTKADGHGLGLAIANRIVERHGGRLVADNHPEGGAEFSIYLPFTPGAEVADAVDTEPADG